MNERCVKCEKCPQNDHFSNIYFQPLRPLTQKIENNQKRKPMCTTTMYLALKLIWFDYLALALSEPLPGNQRPKKTLKRNNSWLVADIYIFFVLIKRSFNSHICLENFNKINAEVRKIFKFQKASIKKNIMNNLNHYINRKDFRRCNPNFFYLKKMRYSMIWRLISIFFPILTKTAITKFQHRRMFLIFIYFFFFWWLLNTFFQSYQMTMLHHVTSQSFVIFTMEMTT